MVTGSSSFARAWTLGIKIPQNNTKMVASAIRFLFVAFMIPFSFRLLGGSPPFLLRTIQELNGYLKR